MGLTNTTKIYITLSLTVALMISELVIGYAYNSNTLIADSFHMFSDAISFIVSLIAVYSKPKLTDKVRKTFGYRRAEQVGAMIHGSLLLGLSFSVGTAAIVRLITPEKIEDPLTSLIVGSTGLIVDVTGIALFFQADLKEANMNIRSLFLEKMGDLAGTIVVIITCALSYVYDDAEWVGYVDPIGTLVFCCILLWATREIYKMVIRILMQDAPSGFEIEALNQQIEKDAEVVITHNNVWQIDSHEIVMSITVEPKNPIVNLDQHNQIKDTIKAIFNSYCLNDEFNFDTQNVTIQINEQASNDMKRTIPTDGNMLLSGYNNEACSICNIYINKACN